MVEYHESGKKTGSSQSRRPPQLIISISTHFMSLVELCSSNRNHFHILL